MTMLSSAPEEPKFSVDSEDGGTKAHPMPATQTSFRFNLDEVAPNGEKNFWAVAASGRAFNFVQWVPTEAVSPPDFFHGFPSSRVQTN
jgi:hypothetical protein